MRAAETVDMAGGDVVRIMTSGAPAYQHLPSPSPAPAPDKDTYSTTCLRGQHSRAGAIIGGLVVGVSGDVPPQLSFYPRYLDISRLHTSVGQSVPGHHLLLL